MKEVNNCCMSNSKDMQNKISLLQTEIIYLNKQLIKHEKAEKKHKRIQKRLKESEKKYRFIFDSSPRGIFYFDINGKISTCNKIFATIIGLKKRYILGNTIMCFIRDERMRAAIRRCLSGNEGFYEGDYFSNPTGKGTTIKATFSPVLTEEGGFIGGIGIVEDTTESTKMKNLFSHQVLYDPLTNLPNKEQFVFRLEKAIAAVRSGNGYRFAVLFIDLDHFKVINDSMGHIVGDKLLITISKKLKQCLRNGDLVSRFGGDEFAILLENIAGSEDAIRAAEKIQKNISVSFKLNNQDVFTTNSIGIALSLTGYDRVEEVLRDADTALYQAKALGRARYEIFDSNMRYKVIERLQLENDLRKSIEENQMETYYQPIISLKTGKILSLEALARWKHPERGYVSPEKFIPLAEETGLINIIGEKIIQTACKQNMEWHSAGFTDLRMSVNVSAKQFQHKNLCNTMENILEVTGMSSSTLEMEITENVAMENTTHSIKALKKLNQMGIGISIDDFGTGYSSLGYLKKFPLHTIKIDKSFISDLTTNSDAKAIIHAIIEMANNLNLKVIAEGVETKEQLSFLQSNNCDAVQGFLLCRPEPAETITKLLNSNGNSWIH